MPDGLVERCPKIVLVDDAYYYYEPNGTRFQEGFVGDEVAAAIASRVLEEKYRASMFLRC